jgi:hypothetical protein
MTLQNPADSADPRLYTAHRLDKVLGRRPVLPAVALTHRLCEVGSPRVDAFLAWQDIRYFCSQDRLLCTADGIYYSAETQVGRLLHLIWDTLSELRLDAWGNYLEPDGASLCLALHAALKGLRISEIHEPDTLDSSSNCFNVMRPRKTPVSVLVIDGCDWIYPNNQIIWAHLKRSAESGYHALYVSRKIAPITFPLLGALDTLAKQYYGLYIPTRLTPRLLKDAERIGLPKPISRSGFRKHAVIEQVQTAIGGLPAGPWPGTELPALQDAFSRGFHQRTASPREFADWAQSHSELPIRWTKGIEAWASGTRPFRVVPSKRRRRRSSPVPDPRTPTAKEGKRGVAWRDEHVTRVPFRL